MSKSLNNLFSDDKFVGFGLPKRSQQVKQLSYIDNTIMFRLGDKYSIHRMMKVLCQYEQVSGQMINMDKSFYYIHEKTPLVLGMRLRKLTEIKIEIFPFTDFRCPVFY